MRLRYVARGDATQSRTCVVFGHAFMAGEWTEGLGFTDDEIAALAANPMFESEEDWPTALETSLEPGLDPDPDQAG